MRKFVYFFALVVGVVGASMFFSAPTNLRAEVEQIELTQDMLLNTSTWTDSKNYYLTSDLSFGNKDATGVIELDIQGIVEDVFGNPINIKIDGNGHTIKLEQAMSITNGWNNVSLSNLIFDGNGFTITTDSSLFSSLENGCIIKNLGVIPCADFSFSNESKVGQVTAYGVIAHNLSRSKIIECYVDGKISVDVNGDAYVGAIAGYIIDGSAIQYSYVKTSLTICQKNEFAIDTYVGTIVGYVAHSQILNCYAVALNEDLAYLKEGKSMLAIGGIVGYYDNSQYSLMTNCFSVGNVLCHDPENGQTIYKGKLVGYMQNDEGNANQSTFSFCHGDADSKGVDTVLVGNLENKIFLGVNFVNKSTLRNFSANCMADVQYVWNSFYPWDRNSIIWDLNSSDSFPILQVFESFYITINPQLCENNKLTITMFDEKDQEIDGTSPFKFGTQIKLVVKIDEALQPYYCINSICGYRSGKQIVTYTKADNKKEVEYNLIVNGTTEDSYYATNFKVEYKLKVLTTNGQGTVGLYNSSKVQNEETLTHLTQSYIFTAYEANLYTFYNWVWVLPSGENGDVAIKGSQSDGKFATKNIIFMLVDENYNFANNDSITYIYMKSNDVANVPSTIDENGVVTFTIRATFTLNTKNVSIKTDLVTQGCVLYVDGSCVNDATWGYNEIYSIDVAVGRYLEIKIEVLEGFTFHEWSLEGGKSLAKYINVNEGQSEKSTLLTINTAQLNDDLVLIMDITQDTTKKFNMNIIWFTLGGIAVAGVITLIVVLAVRRKKREGFLSGY